METDESSASALQVHKLKQCKRWVIYSSEEEGRLDESIEMEAAFNPDTPSEPVVQLPSQHSSSAGNRAPSQSGVEVEAEEVIITLSHSSSSPWDSDACSDTSTSVRN